MCMDVLLQPREPPVPRWLEPLRNKGFLKNEALIRCETRLFLVDFSRLALLPSHLPLFTLKTLFLGAFW